MRKHILNRKTTLLAACAALVLAACSKDDYFIDGGLSRQSEAEMKMPVYDFLASRPNHMFDSLIKIIDLTDAKNIVNQPDITFFAAPNSAVQRLQMNYNPDDRQTPRPLAMIGKDTLLNLLSRFIIKGNRVTLEDAVRDKEKYYKALNGDSLYLFGRGGGINAGSSIQTSAYYLEYSHLKIPGVDSIRYSASFQTHNLKTANAVVHVLRYDASYAAGLIQRYFR